MKDLQEKAKALIKEGYANEAITILEDIIRTEKATSDEVYYLLGNAYRKKGDWQGALNNYQEAMEINPESPARDAKQMIMDILNFYNKDMFNQ